jgi:glyoxylase-like metal-dependent hydrolase (beta-lactamase superfamily II)
MPTSGWNTVGAIQVAAVADGYVEVPPAAVLPRADWAAHRELIGADGLLRLSVGGFLVRTEDRTVLVDAGFGLPSDDPDSSIFRCGLLPASLRSLGVAPAEVDTVVCSHLHGDHAGWLVSDGRPFFPNATVRFGVADWAALIENVEAPAVGEPLRAGMRMLEREGRLDPVRADGEAIAPGVTTRAAPGHTPGHQLIVISSGADRLTILGDVIACPLQITQPDLEISADVDPELAKRTRDTIVRELEGERVSGPHFPDLKLGRILRGEGRRYYTAP